jgi:hypothetical protein
MSIFFHEQIMKTLSKTYKRARMDHGPRFTFCIRARLQSRPRVSTFRAVGLGKMVAQRAFAANTVLHRIRIRARLQSCRRSRLVLTALAPAAFAAQNRRGARTFVSSVIQASACETEAETSASPARVYRRAVVEALPQTGLPETEQAKLPNRCPWTVDELLRGEIGSLS